MNWTVIHFVLVLVSAEFQIHLLSCFHHFFPGVSSCWCSWNEWNDCDVVLWLSASSLTKHIRKKDNSSQCYSAVTKHYCDANFKVLPYYIKEVFKRHLFSTKKEHFLCILAVHDNSLYGAWKQKIMKTSFKVQVLKTIVLSPCKLLKREFVKTVMSCTSSAVKWLITSKIKVFVFIIYVCTHCMLLKVYYIWILNIFVYNIKYININI